MHYHSLIPFLKASLTRLVVGTTSAAVGENAARRHQHMMTQMGTPAKPINMAPIFNRTGATTPVGETTAMTSHQEKVGERSSTILVAFEARRSDNPKTTDASLGMACQPYSDKLTMLRVSLLQPHPRIWIDCAP